MRKYVIEWSMACLLLISFYFLSRQAAQVSAELGKQKNTETIMVDPGHGGKDPGMVGVGGLEEKRDQSGDFTDPERRFGRKGMERTSDKRIRQRSL